VFSARELSSPTEYGCSLGGGHCRARVGRKRQPWRADSGRRASL